MSSPWIVIVLYFLIVVSLGIIVWWEFNLIRKRTRDSRAAGGESPSSTNTLPVE